MLRPRASSPSFTDPGRLLTARSEASCSSLFPGSGESSRALIAELTKEVCFQLSDGRVHYVHHSFSVCFLFASMHLSADWTSASVSAFAATVGHTWTLRASARETGRHAAEASQRIPVRVEKQRGAS